MWHYRMDLEKCQDPTENDFNGEELKFPSNTYYPPGLVCAKEQRRYFCPSSGESGSALMTEDKDSGKLVIDGLLSFIKGCGAFSFDQSYGSLYPYISLFNPQDFGLEFSVLFQLSNNPSAYTKLSCFLSWIAEQYDLEFESPVEDDVQCVEGTGDIQDVTEVENKDCRSNPSSYFESSPFSVQEELPCLLPFYLENQRIEACIQLGRQEREAPKIYKLSSEIDGLNYPVFTCPVWNITTKYPGTSFNSYTTTNLTSLLDINGGLCPDESMQNPGDLLPPLNPDISNCSVPIKPFAQCKNNCPGGVVLFLSIFINFQFPFSQFSSSGRWSSPHIFYSSNHFFLGTNCHGIAWYR